MSDHFRSPASVSWFNIWKCCKLADKLMEHFKSGTYDQIEIFIQDLKCSHPVRKENNIYRFQKVEKSQSENNAPKHKRITFSNQNKTNCWQAWFLLSFRHNCTNVYWTHRLQNMVPGWLLWIKHQKNAETMLGELKDQLQKPDKKQLPKNCQRSLVV